MSLYILSFTLLVLGLLLSCHRVRDVYRDTWAFVLMICGFIVLAVKVAVDLWSLVSVIFSCLG
jgi:hypothetical protein